VFITYTWPATPSRWAYFGDLETTTGSASHFRVFLQYLADTTDAQQIHIIGYSAGTRMVARALEQLAFIYRDKSRETIQERLRLGHMILVGSDIDRQIFGTYLADGLLKIPRHLTIYLSDVDAALGISRWLFGRQRLCGALRPLKIGMLFANR
jgi:esterase/lipase superfamily enzyme